MAHENLKVHLIGKPGKSFVANLTHNVYSWSVKISDSYFNYRIFEEVSIREDATGKTRLDLDYRPHYRFDCVFFIEPGYRALNQRQVYTVGIELKGSKADLMADDKIEHYLDYTDFFFIGVPSELVSDAINKVLDKFDGKIGVFSVDDGKIHLMPARMEPSAEYKRDLLEQIMYSRMFGEDFKGSVSFRLDDIEVLPPSFRDNIVSGVVQTDSATTPTNVEVPDGAQMQQTGTEPVDGSSPTPYDDTYHISPEEPDDADAAYREQMREKEQARREKHNAKVAVLQQEVASMNKDVSPIIVSILEGLSLGDQRVYHAIRRNGGVQAQAVAELLPEQEGIEKPSLATIKRSISALTAAGLIEREGSRKTGQYITKEVDCESDSCQVCAKSPLCRQFQQI